MNLRYRVSVEAIQQMQNMAMSSLTIGKGVHNIPIMKIHDTGAAYHLKACGFDQLDTAMKGKMGDHPILDLLHTLSSYIPMETSSAFDKAEKVRKNMIAGATDTENFLGVRFLIFKGSMYPKKITVSRKKIQHGIAYLRFNCHLDGKLYDAILEQDRLDTQFCLKLSHLKYYKGSDIFVALSEIICKRNHQSPHSNAKLWSLFYKDSGDGRLDNVKRHIYPVEDQAGQYNYQWSKNDDDTLEHQSIRLTCTTLGQSTTPKSDFIMEGDGSIVISRYGNTNLLTVA